MGMRYFAVCFALLTGMASADDWKWETSVRSDGVAVIFAGREGYGSLNEAVDSIARDTWIKHVVVPHIYRLDELQADLNAHLAAHYPAAFEAALASAGNLHNPRVIALHDGFAAAVLASGYVKAVNEAFAQRCERIMSVGHEKFFISRRFDPPRFDAMVWLTTEECVSE